MPIKIRINIKDKGASNFKTKEVKRIKELSYKDTEALAKRCETVIRYMIETKTDGGTGKLANSPGWNAEPIRNGWGVGDIQYLNENNKYWRHLNYGSLAIGANWQHWLPKGMWSNGRWLQSEDGYFSMPQTPIDPVNYIESTLAQMEIEIPRIINKG